MNALSAMAYVDLNPIRAGLCETPEESAYTSIEAWLKPLKPEAVNARLAQAVAEMATSDEKINKIKGHPLNLPT